MSDLSAVQSSKNCECIDTGDVVKVLGNENRLDLYFMAACVIGKKVYSTGHPIECYNLDECVMFGKSGEDYRLDKLTEMMDYPVDDIRREYAISAFSNITQLSKYPINSIPSEFIDICRGESK